MMTTFQVAATTAGSMTGIFTFVILLIVKISKKEDSSSTITREDLDNARMDAVFQTKLTSTMTGLDNNMRELLKQSIIQTESMKADHKRLGEVDNTLDAISKEFNDITNTQHTTQKIIQKIAKKVLN